MAQNTAAGPAARQGRKGERTLSQILECATDLFVERGIAGTNLIDIAAAAGLSRPAIYYYFRSKEELLETLVSDSAVNAAARLAEVAAGEGTPAEIIRRLAIAQVCFVLERPGRFRVIDRNEKHLPPTLAARQMEGKRKVLTIVQGVIERGVAAGAFRPVNPAVTALSIIGMCNWSAWWFREDGPLDIADVADRIADLAVHSLARDPGRGGEGAEASFRAIEQELAHLRRRIGSK